MGVELESFKFKDDTIESGVNVLIFTSSTIERWKTTGEPKVSHLWRKLLYSFLSAGGVKLEIAALFKPGHSKPT